MRAYTEEQVIAILDHIERNGFNDDCITMNEELDHLNSIGVVKNCSIPNVGIAEGQLKAIEEMKLGGTKQYALGNDDAIRKVLRLFD